MTENLNMSSSPHIRAKATTKEIMLYVLIALLPATIFGIYHFRDQHAWIVILVTVVTCVATEFIYEKCMKREITIGDGSAAVTGLLLALSLPPNATWWLCVLGGIFAILIVKQLFGGLGQNFMNPALAARCFLVISFTGRMTNFVYDGVSSATPLMNLKDGLDVPLIEMFWGRTAGTIGETSVIALMIGAMFLILMDVIDLRISGSYLLTFVIFIVLFGGYGVDTQYITAHLCGGGLMLAAWFMATDYVTSPSTTKGQIIYGISLGIFTGLFRLFGGMAEGASYAILLGNLLVPLIDKMTPPRAFGKGGKNEK
jgi:electron transport complex, RnfABCDGE type, D subunit